MVAHAQVGGIEQAGEAQVDPVLDVVQFAERDRRAAAGKGATLIAQSGGAADRQRPGFAGPADIKDTAGATEDDGQNVGVAGDAPDGLDVQGQVVAGLPDAA